MMMILLRLKYRNKKKTKENKTKNQKVTQSTISIPFWNHHLTMVGGLSCTWLKRDISDNNVSISGFQTVQADQDHTESSQRKGGRPAVHINNRWYNPGHVNIKEKNGSIARTLNCWLLGSGHIICSGRFHTPLP